MIGIVTPGQGIVGRLAGGFSPGARGGIAPEFRGAFLDADAVIEALNPDGWWDGYDASTFVPFGDTEIATVTDKSGNGRDMDVPDNDVPTVTQATGIGDLPLPDFGVAKRFRADFAATVGDFTLLLAMPVNIEAGADNCRVALGDEAPLPGQDQFRFQQSTTTGTHEWEDLIGGAIQNTLGPVNLECDEAGFSAPAAGVVSIRRNGSTGQVRIETHWFDGSSYQADTLTATGITGNQTIDSISWGGRTNTVASPTIGPGGALVFFESELSDSDTLDGLQALAYKANADLYAALLAA